MPDIIILPQNFEPAATGKVKITGIAMESGSSYFIGWDTLINYTDNAAQINTTLINAAIAEFGRANITIGVADKKILLAAAA
jgi:hypothetical protein